MGFKLPGAMVTIFTAHRAHGGDFCACRTALPNTFDMS